MTGHELHEGHVDDPADANGGLELIISRVLRVGVLTSLIVMVSGILIGFIDGSLRGGRSELDALIDPEQSGSYSVSQAWESLSNFGGRGVMTLGLCVLIATPMVRVVVSLIGYMRSRDVIYATLTLTVLGALAVSMLLGVGG